MRKLFIIGLMLLVGASVAAQDGALLTVATWNVESGEADPETIADQMAEFEDIDLWGLTEVESDFDAEIFELGAEAGRGEPFGRVISETGGEDRLLALYNEARFELVEVDELEDANPTGRLRSPLVLLLRDLDTGLDIAFVVNHLKSGNAPDDRDERHAQAIELNAWGAAAASFDLPVIAVGDYNFYYEVDGSGYDDGLDLMEADGVFEWIEPVDLVNTQCTVDGNGCRFNSVVDFIFAAGPAQDWDGIAEVIVREGDFPDDDTTSDHRPVVATFELGR